MRQKIVRNCACGGHGSQRLTGWAIAKRLKTRISGSINGKNSEDRGKKMEIKNDKPKRKQDIVFDLVRKFPGIFATEMKAMAGFPCSAVLSHLYTKGLLVRKEKAGRYRYFVSPHQRKGQVLHREQVPSPAFIENCKLYDKLHGDFVRVAA